MALTITPEVYFHRHVLGAAPTMDFNVTIAQDGNWTLFNDPAFLFSIQGEIKPEHNGAGTVSVEIGLSGSVNSLESGFYERQLRVISQGEEKFLTVYLIVATASEDFLYPETMNFESVRNVQEAEPQTIYVASQDDFVSIELPDFLELPEPQPFAFDSGRAFVVKPKYFFDTPDPEYSGEILINFLHFTKTVPVNYIIHSGFDQNFSKDVHFTRDNDELVFYKTTTDKTFMRLTSTVKIFGYDGLVKNEFSLPLDMPFINNVAKINLGRELEPYFKLFDKVLPLTNKVNAYYPPMEVSISALELKYDDFSVVNEDLLQLQTWLRGRNPREKFAIENPFWLDFRPNSNLMVTQNAIINLQVFKPANRQIRKINVYVNDEFKQSIDVGMNGFNPVKACFLYAPFRVNSIPGILPGDEISFEYEGMPERRNFFIKPTQPNSFKIAYRTIWETMDILEFTGSAEITTDYTHDLTETIRNFVEVSNKIRTEKTQKIILNSGWIDKNSVYLFDQLVNSKKALLLADSNFSNLQGYDSESPGNIELVPTQTKLANFQSDENKVSFDVEFIINKRYADEIYSR